MLRIDEFGMGCVGMGLAMAPRSLRAITARNSVEEKLDGNSGKAASVVAGLIAVASVSSGAQAQQSALPPVNVDAPVERQRPAASKQPRR